MILVIIILFKEKKEFTKNKSNKFLIYIGAVE